MKLTIEIAGQLERVIVTTLPQRFIRKIFRHCVGKNNTPYFANNCFKGVLYFDYELAVKFAQNVDFTWSTWREAAPLYQTQGYVFEQYAEITAQLDQGEKIPLSTGELETAANVLDLDNALRQIAEDEVCILLGAVDKGSECYEIEVDTPFDCSSVLVRVDSLECFRLADYLVTGITYGGKSMKRIPGKHVGKNMVTPVLFSKDGRELDLYDFLGPGIE